MNDSAANAPHAAISPVTVVGSVLSHEPDRQDRRARRPVRAGAPRGRAPGRDPSVATAASMTPGRSIGSVAPAFSPCGGNVAPTARQPHDREGDHQPRERARREVPPQRRAVLVAHRIGKVLVDPLRQVVHELEEAPRGKRDHQPDDRRQQQERQELPRRDRGRRGAGSRVGFGHGTSFRRVRRGLPRCSAGAPGRSPACARAPPHPQRARPRRTRRSPRSRSARRRFPDGSPVILRAASIPPMPGIRTSSSTSSGRRRSTAATACSPDPTSPTGSNPAVALITSRAAWRKTTWSSTVRTLTTLTSVSVMLRCPWRSTLPAGNDARNGACRCQRGGVCPPLARSRASDRRSGPGR